MELPKQNEPPALVPATFTRVEIASLQLACTFEAHRAARKTQDALVAKNPDLAGQWATYHNQMAELVAKFDKLRQ